MKEFIGYTIGLLVYTLLVGLFTSDWLLAWIMLFGFGEGMLVLQKAIEFHTDRADRRRFQQILAQHSSPNSQKG